MKNVIIMAYFAIFIVLGLVASNLTTYLKTGGEPQYAEYDISKELSVKEAKTMLGNNYKSEREYEVKATIGKTVVNRLFDYPIVTRDTLNWGVYY